MSDAGTFVCPNCTKRFAWKPQLAGKKVTCKCGTVFSPVPESAPRMAAAPTSPPSTPTYVAPPADPLADQMQRYGVRQRVIVEEEDPDDTPFLNFYLPAALLALALALRFGHVILQPPEQGVLYSLVRAVFELIINLAVVFAAAWMAIQFMGVHPGPLGRSALKLLAIAVLALALSELVVTIDAKKVPIDGMHLALMVNLFTFWMGFFGLFRSLDLQESMMTVAVISVFQIGSNCFIWSTRQGAEVL